LELGDQRQAAELRRVRRRGVAVEGKAREENRLAWMMYLPDKNGKRKEIRYKGRKNKYKKKKTKTRGVLGTFYSF
jgi:hypothetical protein